jgi:hypothetical protein
MNTPSPALVWSFAALSLLVAIVFPIAVYWSSFRGGAQRETAVRASVFGAMGVVAWMAATAAAAESGALDFGRMPPPIGVLFLIIVFGGIALARSAIGTRLAVELPLAALVGIHAFRLPLELLMHRAYSEGVMPVQMSFSGYNFDILTGASAIVVAFLVWKGRMPVGVVRVWNWAGLLLLGNILTIAWLSTPTPLRVFMNEPANVWITVAPFVWLPAVMVMTAFVGHLLLFRRLRFESAARTVGTQASPYKRQGSSRPSV